METYGRQGVFESVADSVRVVLGNKWYKVKTGVTINRKETRLGRHIV